MGYLRWMPLGGGGAKPEARNRGAKPRREMKSNGSCVLWLIATLVGRQGNSDRYTDGQVWGSPHTGAKIAFDVGIVEPNQRTATLREAAASSHFST